MVEVLAALLVLAIGVLGYAGLQLRALKGATAAQTRVRAVMLARSALELMRVNPGRDYTGNDWTGNDWTGNDWTSGNGPPAGVVAGSSPPDRDGCIAQACDGAAMQAWNIRQLTWQAATDLPLGRIVVVPCTTAAAGETPLCVLVSWGGQSADSCIGNGRMDGRADTGESSHCVVLEGGR